MRELLERTDSRELAEWQAFYQLEPFGVERGDVQAGIVASTIANVNRDRKKRAKPYTPNDFMPKFDEAWQRSREPSWMRMLRTVEMLNSAMGGKDLRRTQ